MFGLKQPPAQWNLRKASWAREEPKILRPGRGLFCARLPHPRDRVEDGSDCRREQVT